jgi:Protein of unknown function (DUF3565)
MTNEQKNASVVTPITAGPVSRKISAFRQDESGTWVAELECGHTQHVRHDPPWTSRPWVTTDEGRRGYIGRELKCPKCSGAATERTTTPTGNSNGGSE